jgi:hypothetical protein
MMFRPGLQPPSFTARIKITGPGVAAAYQLTRFTGTQTKMGVSDMVMHWAHWIEQNFPIYWANRWAEKAR